MTLRLHTSTRIYAEQPMNVGRIASAPAFSADEAKEKGDYNECEDRCHAFFLLHYGPPMNLRKKMSLQ